MNKFLKVGAVGLLAFVPFLALAETLLDVGRTLGDLVGLATPIVVALALVFFFWGLAQFILSDSEEKKKEAIGTMVYGIIALFVMVSVWGIVNVLQDTFNVGGTQTVTPPSVQGVGR